MIRQFINKGLGIWGYELGKKKPSAISSSNEFTMFSALNRCIERGLVINTVIDVGASDGCWTRECLKLIPNANYLLIEAQEPHKDDLVKLKLENNKIEYILAAAGSREGKIYFDNGGLFGGLASEVPFEKNCIEVPVIRIDNEIEKRKLSGPYLIKLDTHGFEVPIVEGALETINKAALVIIETYNYQIAKDSLKFYEMCQYMEGKGFYPVEMVDFMLRKFDNSFWQMDTFFVPKGNSGFKHNAYE